MTLQEAIKTLKKEHLGDSENMELAKQMGAIALEKQIPKKVLTHNGYIECPYCETDIKEGKGNSYCLICGQALDWSEEE